ncbi:hypothetical protein HK099_005675 [Clydaea vesicula]|uniref:C2H2-type domain-containing protein n=1 Tax=Clydaea vesicula TaxID=447962 RepID=A0AAD5XUS2_9FUNG
MHGLINKSPHSFKPIEKTFTCEWDVCDQQFNTEKNLFYHVITHLPEGRQQCKWRKIEKLKKSGTCGISCRHKGYSMDHIVSHFSHQIRPLTCSQCALTFRNRQDKRKHEIKFHNKLTNKAVNKYPQDLLTKTQILSTPIVASNLAPNNTLLREVNYNSFSDIQNSSQQNLKEVHSFNAGLHQSTIVKSNNFKTSKLPIILDGTQYFPYNRMSRESSEVVYLENQPQMKGNFATDGQKMQQLIELKDYPSHFHMLNYNQYSTQCNIQDNKYNNFE